MAIKGRNVLVENLSLDGALIVDSIDDAEVWKVHSYLLGYIVSYKVTYYSSWRETGKTWRLDQEQWLDHGNCRLQGHIGSRGNKNQRF